MSAAPPTISVPSAATSAASCVPGAFTLLGVGYLVGAAALVGALFASTFRDLLGLWDRDQNYSHGYIVLPICAWLAYRVYRRVGAPIRCELTFGLVSLFFGILCECASTVVRTPFLSFVGLFFVCRGLLVCAGGRVWAAAFNFPLAFLFFMFPLPVKWTSYSALWLQDIVARVSENIIGLFYVCHRVGHSIQIAGVDRKLFVAAECSGLGQIVSFLAFALLLGHLLARPMWQRVALVIASGPVAIASNTLSVTLMNFGAVWFGTSWIGTKFHDTPVLITLPLGVALFLLIDHLLGRHSEKKAASAEREPTVPVQEQPASAGRSSEQCSRRGLLFGCVFVVVGVAAQYGIASHIRSAGELTYPQLTGRFESLPLTTTDSTTGQRLWQGEDLIEIREHTRKKLPFHADDLLYRGYRNATGAFVFLYMVHSRIGEDRKHHPEICVRDAGGAPEDISFRKQIPLPAGGAVQRFRFQRGQGQTSVLYYWHYTPTPIPNDNLTKLQRLHQEFGVPSPSITVQLSLATDDPNALMAVENQLLPALDREMRQRVLPPGTVAGCDRVPITLVRE